MLIEFDPAKNTVNLDKHGIALADAGLVYFAPAKLTLTSPITSEQRLMDVAWVVEAGTVLVLVYVERGKKGGCMKPHKKTDWNRVQADAAADAPLAPDPEGALYDPNNAAATEAFWEAAKVVRRGRPALAVKRPTLNMRVDADILEHLRGLGRGWQTKVNALLREAVAKKRL